MGILGITPFAAKSRSRTPNPAPAEAAFLAAIAIAQQQKTRSFELRAALSLAKLYQSTGRPIDVHDVLAPALEGFSPTPEFPTGRRGEGGSARPFVSGVRFSVSNVRYPPIPVIQINNDRARKTGPLGIHRLGVVLWRVRRRTSRETPPSKFLVFGKKKSSNTGTYI